MLGHGLGRLDDRHDIGSFECGDKPYLFVPGEVLIAQRDVGRLREPLKELGLKQIGSIDAIDVAQFEVRKIPVHATVQRLRAAVHPEPAVAPHHVCSGSPKWAGGPAVPATASVRTAKLATSGAGKGVRVAVLDTGYTDGLHPDLDAHIGTLPPGPEETDSIPPNGWLDDEAGHGTFIAGIVASLAPSAEIEIGDVLDSQGFGRELAIAEAIIHWAREGVDIINLSLGAYSEDDRLPLAIGEALRHVRPGSVVVAAAGNDCWSRPFWPAAAKRVIGVGAIDDNDPPRPARFTNYGSWVDCCAPGVDIDSTFLEYDELAASLTPPALPGRTPQRFAGWATWSGTSFSAPFVSGTIAARQTMPGFASAYEAALDVIGRPGLPQVANLGVVVR